MYELDTTLGPLRAKARGPYVVKAVKSNGTVVLTYGETDFKDEVDFERHVSLLSKYFDESNVRLSSRGFGGKDYAYYMM